MTEYDYSPEAYERYLATQNRIARWVDNTLQHNPRNPFTPATPAVQALKDLEEEEQLAKQRRRDHRHRDRHPSKHRHTDKHSSNHTDDREHHRSSSSSKPSRHRSASQSAAPSRPPPLRAQTSPVAYEYDYHSSSSNPSPTKPTYSRRSSRTSSTTLPHSGSTAQFPPQQLPYALQPQPRRSNTTPAAYGADHKTPHPYPVYPTKQHPQPLVVPIPNSSGYFAPPPGKTIDLVSQRQLPYAAYQMPSPTKQPPLLKRLFVGLTGGIKNGASKSGSNHKRRGSY
ncbi:hypothetical protein BDQ17DRAFT_1322987 [Cyathus striatus]|nr:hypothetical protein BDQ17DRAFT_1322987 [Cyathus striatus]